MQVCLFLLITGLFLAWQGKKMHDEKRSRIERIFRETREHSVLETPLQILGPNAATPRTGVRGSRLLKGSATGTTP